MFQYFYFFQGSVNEVFFISVYDAFGDYLLKFYFIVLMLSEMPTFVLIILHHIYFTFTYL